MNAELILTTTIGVLQVLATGLIAWIVYSQTQKLKRFEHGRQVIEAYNVLNTAAVSSDANLLAFDRALPRGREVASGQCYLPIAVAFLLMPK